MAEALRRRRSPVHYPPRIDHDRPIIIFLTVCTAAKKPILANDETHNLLLSAWSDARAWLVGRYVIMPDHVHLFCAPGSMDATTLARWVRYWKTLVSRRCPRPQEQPIWQKSCWDTQLRRGEAYAEKWEYVRHNPVRAGLCEDPEAWPYQGEINVLAWRD